MPNEMILRIHAAADADEKETVDLARQLRQQLLELNEIERIDPTSLPMAPQSKAAGGIDWSTLIVTLAASGGVLTTFISAVQTWLSRHEQTSITVKLGGDELMITGAAQG